MGFSRAGYTARHLQGAGRAAGRALRIAAIALLTAALPLTVSVARAAACIAFDDASLNDAIVNASCGAITLVSSITLNNNLPLITRDLTIDGGGFAIDGDGAFQALQVISGTVAISNLTIKNSVATGIGGGVGQGGALFVGSAANVTIANVQLTNNEAIGGNSPPGSANNGGNGLGGAIYDAGSLTVSNSTIASNTATGGTGANVGGTGSGGGIYVAPNGSLTVSNSTIANNSATGVQGANTGGTGFGGGIDNQGVLTLSNSTIASNVATGGSGTNTGGMGSGGGIDNQGVLTLSNSTITSNVATGGSGTNTGGMGSGGGIDNQGGVTLSNAVIASNSALGGTGNLVGGNAVGGGIDLQSGNNLIATSTLTIQNNAAIGGTGNQISGNAAGGGVYVNSGNLTLSPLVGVTQTIGDEIGGNSSLTKDGLGNLILSAANTYSGTTTVNDGVLIVGRNGALGGGVVTVNAPGVLDLGTTKQIVPGLDLGGALADTLAGTGVGQYGKVDVTGMATIAGELDLSLAGGFEPAVGDQFAIMGFNVLSGDFTGIVFDGIACGWTPSGSGGIADCAGGLDLSLTELSGDNPDPFLQLAVLSVVPEPGTLALLGSGLGILLILPWRESRRVRRSE